jgi:serine/threonine-protein kinase/endoribonuclease IRE1
MSEVKKFDFRNLLGEGSYGKVFLGDWDGVKVAIKRVEISNTQNNGQEEEAMRKLNHPNVIKLFYVESDPVFRYTQTKLKINCAKVKK